MKFAAPLIEARLVRRYKRFLADVILADGSETTVHVANPGAMTGLAAPGARVFLSKSPDPKRKLAYSWELVEADFGAGQEFAGVNTAHPNRLIAEALAENKIPQLSGYEIIRREVKYGRRSRIDFLLEAPGRPACYLEIKNVHLMRVPGRAEFPDCVTARGTRHLDELADIRKDGFRAVLLYVVQIGSAREVAVAGDIDPAYAAAFTRARTAGVEMLARVCHLTHDEIRVDREVPVAD